jgi:hypothetical protein
MKRSRMLVGVVGALLVACDPDVELAPTASPSADVAQAKDQDLLREHLGMFSTMPMLLAAKELGLTEIQGRPVDPSGEDSYNSPKKLVDVPIADHPTAHENEPSVATSPKDKKLLVVGYHFITNVVRCAARHSSDGGMTWSAQVLMPQLTSASHCSDPVLAYSPDGSRVYYAYMDIKFPGFFSDFDIIVSQSTDDGQTWSAPVVALNGVIGAFDYDKPWIGTPDDASNYVYVTATRFDNSGFGNCHIVFTRSINGGTSYVTPTTLESSTLGCANSVVQGSRPSGGKQGSVLVAWYNSGTDGFRSGSFNIRTRHSTDFGATFAPIVVAAIDGFEAKEFKGPGTVQFACYHRWWGVMFPDVEIDPSEGGHIAYTHDPVNGQATAEEGDIRYVTSPGPPYTSWSGPTTVNDDGTVSAQGYVALDIKTEGTGQSAKPHAIWEDDRLPAPAGAVSQCSFFVDVENLFYDIFYSTLQDGGWSANVRVTEESSISDFLFIGDYFDLTVDIGSLYTVWTDRRDKLSIFDLEDDVWGSRTHRVH